MDIGNQLLFFLAGLGVFNGFLLAVFMLLVRPRRIANVIFSLLLLMLCIRIGKSVLHVFTDVSRTVRQIGLSACIFVGPLLLLYLKQFLRAGHLRRLDRLHLLLPFVAIVSIGLIRPYQLYPAFWNQTVIKFIYLVWALYSLAALRLVVPVLKRWAGGQADTRDYWVILVYSSLLLLCLTYVSAYYGFPYLSGPFLFSIVFYAFTAMLIGKNNRQLILGQQPRKYQNNKVDDLIANKLLDRLRTSMEEDRAYLDRKVKLADIAEVVGATPHEISQVINSRLGISFNHFINQYRIEAACPLLLEADHLSIEGIGREVGFNSRSAFYSAFKAVMQQTPTAYKVSMDSATRSQD